MGGERSSPAEVFFAFALASGRADRLDDDPSALVFWQPPMHAAERDAHCGGPVDCGGEMIEEEVKYHSCSAARILTAGLSFFIP